MHDGSAPAPAPRSGPGSGPGSGSPAGASGGSQSGIPGDASIVCVPLHRRLEAIQALLRSDRAAAERFLAFARDTSIRLEGLWACTDGADRIVLSVLAAPSSGRTATIFATQARTESDVVTLALLVDRACRAAHDLDVDLAQALVDPTEHRQLSVFARGGLTRLAALSYLERPLSPFNLPTTPVFPEDLRTERWNPTERAEMIAALEQTYLDTLDCPALAGLRRGDDILEGHMHSGIFEPSLWTVLRYVSGSCAGSVAGVCLFNASPPTAIEPAGSIELVYFGLVPSARGRGIGRMLLHHGLSLLKKRRETTLILAVDDRNTPALAIYRDEGFRTRFRRIAFIRPVTRAPDIGPAHRAPA